MLEIVAWKVCTLQRIVQPHRVATTSNMDSLTICLACFSVLRRLVYLLQSCSRRRSTHIIGAVGTRVDQPQRRLSYRQQSEPASERFSGEEGAYPKGKVEVLANLDRSARIFIQRNELRVRCGCQATFKVRARDCRPCPLKISAQGRRCMDDQRERRLIHDIFMTCQERSKYMRNR